MADEPVPLFAHYRSAGRGVASPRRNAVHGRRRAQLYCRDCAENFENEGQAIRHAALERHVVFVVTAHEIVPVDLDDDWAIWEDGAGVSACDRGAI